jgi:hypothetical protein
VTAADWPELYEAMKSDRPVLVVLCPRGQHVIGRVYRTAASWGDLLVGWVDARVDTDQMVPGPVIVASDDGQPRVVMGRIPETVHRSRVRVDAQPVDYLVDEANRVSRDFDRTAGWGLTCRCYRWVPYREQVQGLLAVGPRRVRLPHHG